MTISPSFLIPEQKKALSREELAAVVIEIERILVEIAARTGRPPVRLVVLWDDEP